MVGHRESLLIESQEEEVVSVSEMGRGMKWKRHFVLMVSFVQQNRPIVEL